jgi:outer membrane protein assembly factor BamB
VAEELVRHTRLNVIVVEPDEGRVAAWRERFADSSPPGARLAVHAGDPLTFRLPPYLASLMVIENPAAVGFRQTAAWVERVYQSLRPYGGVACLQLDDAGQAALSDAVSRAQLAGAAVQRAGRYVLLRRNGSLPGAGNWTHQNGDAGNTLVSDDQLVTLPLGLLWFGGPSNAKILPRHGHGPMPQVIDGRLLIEGPDLLRAVDIYTGRLLWEHKLKDLGVFYNNTAHQPGAGAIGGNYASAADGIYVAYGRKALRLDPASGRTVAEFQLPPHRDAELPPAATADRQRPYWGYISVFQDLLLAGSSPLASVTTNLWRPDATNVRGRFGESSRRLVVLDRYSGRVLWTRDADDSFRHNAIVAGQPPGTDRPIVFCLDRMTDAQFKTLERRGVRLKDGRDTLYALDGRTGRVVWRKQDNIFGTWLGYSSQYDVLLQTGSKYADRASDEAARGMVAYRGATGEVLWQNNRACRGPCLLLDDRIITQGEAFELLSGQPLPRVHPLTGESLAWDFTRNHGCNTAIGCRGLLTFRSAAAGFFDLAADGGTGNLGGFRSSCTNNLVPAGGLLNVPDYTRTCLCSYQNQTSLALVPMPDVEMWTFNALKWSGRPIRRLGVNFGAPGDRRASDGTLWLDYPSVGGKSPDVPIRVRFLADVPEPEPTPARAGDARPPPGSRLRYFRLHSTQLQGDAPRWVAASGLRGEADIEITLADKPFADQRTYTVRLYFCEVEDVKPGQRRFQVQVQDQTVLPDFDIVAAAGAPRHGVVREIRGVQAGQKLSVALRSANGSARPPLLSGVELIAEGG